jgi:hypothetical protein
MSHVIMAAGTSLGSLIVSALCPDVASFGPDTYGKEIENLSTPHLPTSNIHSTYKVEQG